MLTKEEGDRLFLILVPVVSAGISSVGVVIGFVALWRARSVAQRAYHLDGQYLVSVRYGQWHDLREFITPEDPAVLEAYSQIGPDAWGCLDWVCRNVSYRPDIGELWQFSSETIARASGDCDDSSILACSLLRNFTNAYVVLGSYLGYGHAWCQLGGQILETTYTSARPVPDPTAYEPMVIFNESEVVELWPGALVEVFKTGRNEASKLNLIAKALESVA